MVNDCRLKNPTRRWMRRVLLAAAIYNVVWGTLVILFPLGLFQWAGMSPPRYVGIWQCVGMIVGVYGVGYYLAAADPVRHWPIVLVGFLGKVLGPIGFLQAALQGQLPWAWGVTIITNDLIWWIPFAAILYVAFREQTDTSRNHPSVSLREALKTSVSHRHSSLSELSQERPTLVVFLRHSGCTFCRETLAALRDAQAELQDLGTTVAMVHMGKPMDGTLLAQKYQLENVHRFSDPTCSLYRAFGLSRGRWRQLFAPRIVWKGLRALFRGHGIGTLQGDGFRMPGAFLLVNGKVVRTFYPADASQRPDFVALARGQVSARAADASRGTIRSRGEDVETAPACATS